MQPPVDTKVILGHVASMQCRVSADPNVPFEVDWFHEGRLINAAHSHRINIGKSLRILWIKDRMLFPKYLERFLYTEL